VFSGTISPISEFRNSEIRDTFCAFQGISGISEIDPEKPLFSQKPLCAAVLRDFGNWEISGISGDLGDTFTNCQKISGKFRKPEIQV
jgi:hypothetical protein